MDSFNRDWQSWFPRGKEEKPAPPAPGGWTTSRVLLLLGGAFTLFILLNVAKGFYTEWLWFSSLGYSSVYATILKTKLLLFFSAAVIFCLMFFGSMLLARRTSPDKKVHLWPWAVAGQLQKVARLNLILGTALLSIIFGLVAQGNWQVVLQFFNGQSFGISDPIFQKEVSFYVFSVVALDMNGLC